MFDYFKKASISNRANDELLYEFVLTEMENGTVSKGLWGKALANSSGDDANAKSIYMQYRVQSIKDIFTSMEIAYNDLNKPALFQYIQERILPDIDMHNNIIGNTKSKKSFSDTTTKELQHITKKETIITEAESREITASNEPINFIIILASLAILNHYGLKELFEYKFYYANLYLISYLTLILPTLYIIYKLKKWKVM